MSDSSTTSTTPHIEVKRVQRMIDAPALDWLTAGEVAAWLHIGTTLLKELRESSDFPRPVQFGKKKAQRWWWLDIVSWAHLRSVARETATNGPGPRKRPE